MKNIVEAGGPAFPTSFEVPLPEEMVETNRRTHIDVRSPGITVRDWFAGQALASLASPWPNNAGTPEMDGELARLCYKYADAMLAERAK